MRLVHGLYLAGLTSLLPGCLASISRTPAERDDLDQRTLDVVVSKAEPGADCRVIDTVEGDLDDNYWELRREAAEIGANYVTLDVFSDDAIGRAFHCPNRAPMAIRRRLTERISPSQVLITKGEPGPDCTVIDTVEGEPDRNYEELREATAEVFGNVFVLDGMTSGSSGYFTTKIPTDGDVVGRAVYCPTAPATR